MDKSIPEKIFDESNTNLSGNLLNIALTRINALEKEIHKEKLSRIELMENITKIAQAMDNIISWVKKNQPSKTDESQKQLQDIQKMISSLGEISSNN